MSDEIVAVDGPVIQAHDGTAGSRWEVRHHCGGLHRRVQCVGSVVSCLDCGSAVHVFEARDLESGLVVVLEEGGELAARDER